MKTIKSKIYSILPGSIQKIWDRITHSDIGRRMIKGAFWSLFGSVISRGLMLLASIIIARLLGKTQYGELGIIRSTVNMFVVFAGFGLGVSATKYIAEYRENDKARAGKIIGLSTIFAAICGAAIAIIIFILSPYLAHETINAPHLTKELQIGALMLFFSAINGAQAGILSGFEAFKTIAKINLFAGLLAFPIQIIFTLLWGLTGSVIGYSLNYLILWIINFIYVRKEARKHDIKIQYISSWSERQMLIKFNLPALFSGLLVSPVMWICNAMLVSQPQGYDEMAVFDAANQWKNAILFIPVVLSRVVLSLLSNSLSNKNQFNLILKSNIKLNIIISSIIAIIISLLSPLILEAYGTDFSDGSTVLIILSASTIFISINNVIGQAIASKERMWTGFLFNLIWALLLIGITVAMLKMGYGAKGIAIAQLTSYATLSLVQSIFVKNILSKEAELETVS